MIHETDGRYCEDCFIGWRVDTSVCWQCGHDVPISKEQGQAILAQAGLVDMIARWAARTRAW